jgi:hypothetical protein
VRKTYGPLEVMAWTADDIAALVGKYVDIHIATDPPEGGSGVCISVAVTGEPSQRTVNVAWDWGMAWHWADGQPVYVSVCDEHGDHTSLNGVDCLDRFARGARA